MTNRPLYLHEEVLLLGLNDEKGLPEHGTRMMPALAGAIIGEYFDAGRIRTVKSGREEVVEVVDGEAFGYPLLDEYLETIRESKKARPAKFWAGIFGVKGDLYPRTAQGLCDLGVLGEHEQKFLSIVMRRTYPEVDSTREDQLVERLRAAIFSEDRVIEPRTQMIVAIANQTRLLHAHFEKDELARRKDRIEAITKGDLAGDVVQGAIAAANVSLFMTRLVPMMVLNA